VRQWAAVLRAIMNMMSCAATALFPTSGPGTFGRGLSSVSNSDYLTTPDFTQSIQGASDSFTVDIWLQTSDTTHDMSAFQWGPNNEAPYIGCNSGVVLFLVADTGSFAVLYGARGAAPGSLLPRRRRSRRRGRPPYFSPARPASAAGSFGFSLSALR